MRENFFLRNAPFLTVGAMMTFMSSFGQTFFIAVFSGEIRTEFSLTHGAWGAMYAAGTACSAVAMVWAGSLTDQFRVRLLGPLVLAGLALSCLAMAATPAAWCLPFIIFALRFFGQGMSSHIAIVAMARWFVASRGRALSVASLGFSMGEAILPILFVVLMASIDWRWLWVVAALIPLTAMPFLIRLLGAERTPQHHATSNESTGINGRHWTRRDALGTPLFWLLVPTILGPAAFNTAFFFHQVHFAETKGWQHVELVAFFPLYTLAATGAMLLSGLALDRFSAARLMPYYQLPIALSFVIFAQAGGSGAVLAGLFLLAMTTGANATLPNAFWAEAFGTQNIGAIKALVAGVMVMGSALGPLLTGVAIDAGIGLEQQFIAIAIYFLIATALMWFGIRTVAVDLDANHATRRVG